MTKSSQLCILSVCSLCFDTASLNILISARVASVSFGGLYVLCCLHERAGIGTKRKNGGREGRVPDSYPVAINVFCGVRRLDTRMD